MPQVYYGTNSFSADALVPGRYRVLLRSRHDRTTLFVAENVIITAGRTSEDPRLQDIDLRGKLRLIRVVAEIADKAQYLFGKLFVRSIDARSSWNQVPGKGGFGRVEWSLAVGPPPVDLYLSPFGFRSRLLRGVTEDVTVKLLPELTVELCLHGSVSLPSPDLRLVARLRRRTSTADRPSDSSFKSMKSFYRQAGSFGLNRRVRVPTSAPGRFEISLWLLQRHPPWGFVRVEGVEPGFLDVSEERQTSAVTVRVNSDSLERALKRLKE